MPQISFNGKTSVIVELSDEIIVFAESVLGPVITSFDPPYGKGPEGQWKALSESGKEAVREHGWNYPGNNVGTLYNAYAAALDYVGFTEADAHVWLDEKELLREKMFFAVENLMEATSLQVEDVSLSQYASRLVELNQLLEVLPKVQDLKNGFGPVWDETFVIPES